MELEQPPVWVPTDQRSQREHWQWFLVNLLDRATAVAKVLERPELACELTALSVDLEAQFAAQRQAQPWQSPSQREFHNQLRQLFKELPQESNSE